MHVKSNIHNNVKDITEMLFDTLQTYHLKLSLYSISIINIEDNHVDITKGIKSLLFST
jgi:hypothetical protein